MHYAKDLFEYYQICDTILAQWRKNVSLKSFADYFEKQWINSEYWRWQSFHTPTGYAATNNPCETFDASVKRHVMRKMFDTTRLLRNVIVIAEDVTADKLKPTSTSGKPPTTIVNAAKRLVHARQLALFDTDNPNIVRIVQLRASGNQSRQLNHCANNAFARLITTKTTGQLHEPLGRRQRRKASALHSDTMKWSLYLARRMKMPETDWTVNMDGGSCECRYFLKMGYCCHIIGARMISGVGTYAGSRHCVRLKDRRVRKPRENQTQTVDDTILQHQWSIPIRGDDAQWSVALARTPLRDGSNAMGLLNVPYLPSCPGDQPSDPFAFPQPNLEGVSAGWSASNPFEPTVPWSTQAHIVPEVNFVGQYPPCETHYDLSPHGHRITGGENVEHARFLQPKRTGRQTSISQECFGDPVSTQLTLLILVG